MKHYSIKPCTGDTRLRLVWWRVSIAGQRRVSWCHLRHIVCIGQGSESEHERRVFCFGHCENEEVKASVKEDKVFSSTHMWDSNFLYNAAHMDVVGRHRVVDFLMGIFCILGGFVIESNAI
ncbi:hypothetical protein VNO78_12186 [Psophocarpus tetragonolobus]|uniref:Uncharacterized protein n=1 Tax=Psophocarpus tetragonolobus TaxID=3891 RepID=A0AAN9SPF0_PSOTE